VVRAGRERDPIAAYWDSRAALADLQLPESKMDLNGRWDERNWRNVPGPFYGADTDTCVCGPSAAPLNVLCDEWGQEFVWRQPRTVKELRAVLDGAWLDPFGGYAADGDDHWTPELVMEWWDGRDRLLDWLASDEAAEVRASDDVISRALAEFHDYLNGALHDDLQQYADWLSRRY
jgi:hypothetical protein